MSIEILYEETGIINDDPEAKIITTIIEYAYGTIIPVSIDFLIDTPPEKIASSIMAVNELGDLMEYVKPSVTEGDGITVTNPLLLDNPTISVNDTVVRTPRQINANDGLQQDNNTLDANVNLSVDNTVVRTTRQVNAGDGLEQDNNLLGANVNLAVDNTVVRTSRTVTAGDGLNGTGNLASDITLDVDNTVVRTSRTVTAGDGLNGTGNLASDITLDVDNTVVRTTRQVNAGDGLEQDNNLLGANVNLAVDNTVVRTSRTITTGNGLSGGGNLASNRTLTVNVDRGLSIASDNVGINTPLNSGLAAGTDLKVDIGSTVEATVASGSDVLLIELPNGDKKRITRDNLFAGLGRGAELRGSVNPKPSGAPNQTLTVSGDPSNATISQGVAPTGVEPSGYTYVVLLDEADKATGVTVRMGGISGSPIDYIVFDQDQLQWTGSASMGTFVHLELGDSVISVFDRQGRVTAENGDYTATQIAYTPYLDNAENNVQQALNYLTGNRVKKSGDTMTGSLYGNVTDWEIGGSAGGAPRINFRNQTTGNLVMGAGTDALTGHVYIRPRGYNSSVVESRFEVNGKVYLNNPYSVVAQQTSGDSLTRYDYVTSQDALKVSKAGDTMTGDLVFNSNSDIYMNSGSWIYWSHSGADTIRMNHNTSIGDPRIDFFSDDSGGFAGIRVAKLTATDIAATSVTAPTFIGDLTGTADKVTVNENTATPTHYPLTWIATDKSLYHSASKLTFQASTGTLKTTTFEGDLTGIASSVSVIDHTADNANYPIVWHDNNSKLRDTVSKLTFNPSTGNLKSTMFEGDLTGNATTATNLKSINTTFSGTYPITVNVNGVIYSHTGMTYNGSAGTLTAPTFIGALTGNVTGNLTGNATTATRATTADTWTTPRNFTVTLTGDATGTVTQSVDGSGNETFTVNTTILDDSHNHDGRYYTESESNTRFVNATGDTMTGTLYAPTFSGKLIGEVSAITKLTVPVDTSSSGVQAQFRYHPTNGFEGHDGSRWGSIGGGGAGIPTYIKKTANYTLSSEEGILFDVSTASLTATLPTGIAGDWVSIGDYNGSASLVKSIKITSAQFIHGSNDDLVLTNANTVITLSYIDSVVGWKIVDGIGESAGESSAAAVSVVSTHSGNGTWNITGVKIGVPMYVVVQGNGYYTCKLSSGATYQSNTYGFRLGYGPSTNDDVPVFTIIPTSSTVVLVLSATSLTPTLTAHQ